MPSIVWIVEKIDLWEAPELISVCSTDSSARFLALSYWGGSKLDHHIAITPKILDTYHPYADDDRESTIAFSFRGGYKAAVNQGWLSENGSLVNSYVWSENADRVES